MLESREAIKVEQGDDPQGWVASEYHAQQFSAASSIQCSATKLHCEQNDQRCTHLLLFYVASSWLQIASVIFQGSSGSLGVTQGPKVRR